MTSNLKLKNQKGFTIIEVLIVLAIAGLILLIVFLAVPALQRNNRNTQRKSDVSALNGALSEFINNNNGNLPGDCAIGSCDAEAWMINVNDLSIYDPTTVAFSNHGTTSPGSYTTGTVDEVQIHTFAKCDGNAVTAANATARSVAVSFQVETGGAAQDQCSEI